MMNNFNNNKNIIRNLSLFVAAEFSFFWFTVPFMFLKLIIVEVIMINMILIKM